MAVLPIRSRISNPPSPVGRPASGALTACFRRVYDGEHLRRHPEQATVAVTVSLRRDKGDAIESRTFWLALQQKGSAQALYGWGACWWEAKANLDSEGRRLVPA